MQKSDAKLRRKISGGFRLGWVAIVGIFLSWQMNRAMAADASDPIIDLFLQKGFITETEAAKARAEVGAIRTNELADEMPRYPDTKWKISDGIKSVELFGDVRLRYEDREARDPSGGHIGLQRFRYALRVGLRGDLFDDFYYGFRVDTSANPRSSWVTFGSSSSGSPYNGPFGKSTAGIAVGQAYLGWDPEKWVDLTAGKMPNPLYTTPMVWDPDLNPEGLAERFKVSVGKANLFANFGQFIYQDINPQSASGGLGFNGLLGQSAENIFLLSFQGGVNFHFTTNTSMKVAATLYKYIGLRRSSALSGNTTSPFFGDPYIGEGAFLGPGSGTVDGGSGSGTSGTLPGNSSLGFPLNQVGLNDLLVVEVPFEFDFPLGPMDAQVFGDVAYNLEGRERAEAAANGYSAWLASQPTPPTISGFSPQTDQNKAYQVGFALAGRGSIGLASGAIAKRHGWEVRAFWQHIEQYALDPNIIDSDVFEGRENMEGVSVQAAFGFTQNFTGSIRYAHGDRIDSKLGTGGSNQDVPQMNPIHDYDLLQLDLTFKY